MWQMVICGKKYEILQNCDKVWNAPEYQRWQKQK